MSISDDNQRLDTICRQIAAGRSLARQLAATVRAYQLNEAEFRLLWLLRKQAASIKQSVLATQLGISPAQVSAIVEKLRTQQIIAPITTNHDRRRQLWQLSPDGQQRFESIVAAVGLLSRGWACPQADLLSDQLDEIFALSQREDAA